MWQVTPGTFGSSNSLTQTLSLGESSLNVVLTQARSSARAKPGAKSNSAAAIRSSLMLDFLLAEWARKEKGRSLGPAPSDPSTPERSGAVVGRCRMLRAGERRCCHRGDADQSQQDESKDAAHHRSPR